MASQAICIISGCTTGLTRDSLRPAYKLGKLLEFMNIKFDRVRDSSIDKTA